MWLPLALACLVGGVVVVFRYATLESRVLKVADSFCQSLVQRDYSSAYEQTTADYRRNVGFQTFRHECSDYYEAYSKQMHSRGFLGTPRNTPSWHKYGEYGKPGRIPLNSFPIPTEEQAHTWKIPPRILRSSFRGWVFAELFDGNKPGTDVVLVIVEEEKRLRIGFLKFNNFNIR